jgi:hypothetical protein
VKTPARLHLQDLIRGARLVGAKLSVVSRGTVVEWRTKRAPAVRRHGPSGASFGCYDAPHPTDSEDLSAASGLYEPVMYGGVFGYTDRAGVGHPLF